MWGPAPGISKDRSTLTWGEPPSPLPHSVGRGLERSGAGRPVGPLSALAPSSLASSSPSPQRASRSATSYKSPGTWLSQPLADGLSGLPGSLGGPLCVGRHPATVWRCGLGKPLDSSCLPSGRVGVK